ncbi:MAG: DUF996 domain-containing protein [Bacteroidales bacterium]|nr:DUF996 domain-containing protein [Bacteroidales bacterium]
MDYNSESNNTEISLNKNKLVSATEISDIKLIGGLAALFSLGNIIPYIGFLLSIASMVMFLIAFYKIADILRKRVVFNNILMAYLIGIAFGLGIIVYFFYLFYDFFNSYNQLGIEFFEDIDTLEIFVRSFLSDFLIMLALMYGMVILNAFLWKMSLDKTAHFFNEKLFKTAGLLYIIGAFTLVLCGIGILVTMAGHIVLAIAFFSLKSENLSKDNQ